MIAAICSFFIPGLGQLVQGRLFAAIIQFLLTALLWVLLLGWIGHIWSILDAALYKGPKTGGSRRYQNWQYGSYRYE